MNDELKRMIIARRIAEELSDGDVVNLGIGLPTMVARYIPPGINIILQSENGFLNLARPRSRRRRPRFGECRWQACYRTTW